MTQSTPSLLMAMLHLIIGLATFALAAAGFLYELAEGSNRLTALPAGVLCLVVGAVTLHHLGRMNVADDPARRNGNGTY